MIELRGKYAQALVYTDVVDGESVSQVINLLNQPYTEGSRIRMMPDIHAGAGMDIRHHADAAALGIRLIQQVDDLRYRLPVHHIGVDEGLCIFSSQLDHFVLSFKGSRG